ncbi:MAG: sigma-70 family RNA polymerase sigma factor [Acidobacteriota bacterium]
MERPKAAADHRDADRDVRDRAEDCALAQAAARGDERAWCTLLDRYGDRLYGVARRFAANEAEAEDLTQEIVLQLYRNLHRYDGRAPLLGWTLRLARNRCIDAYRARRARPLAHAVPETVLATLPNGDDPERRAAARQELAQVRAALDALPEELATAFVLRDFEELTYDDIAAALAVPLGTVKSRISRARRALFAALAPQTA